MYIACNAAYNSGLRYCTGSGSSDCCSFYDERSCVASCESNIFINSSFDCVCEQFYQEPARLYRLVRFDSVEEPNYLLYIIDEVKLLVHKSQPDCTVIM